MFDLKGIYCPIATPFIDDKIAYDKLDENLDFWISSKLEGIVVMGSNGEFVSLRESEKEELIRHCCKRIAGKKRVVAATALMKRCTFAIFPRNAARMRCCL